MITSRALLVVSLAACHSSTPSIAKIPDAKPELRDERFVAAIAKAARSYKPWGRVDERPNIAPDLCRMPMRSDYGAASHVRQSKAPEGPHGTKLYYLFASHRSEYLGLSNKSDVPVGFTIIKESFAATPKPPDGSPTLMRGSMHMGIPDPVGWVETDHGKLFTGAPTGVYVMTKLGKRDGTDEGWIYGTVSAKGEVTSAGRVESCMGCHEAATHGRLFGLQPTKKLVEMAPPGSKNWGER